MKTDILLAGVGGQGILSIAAALGQAVLQNQLYLKQAETHGMSQRGGAIVAHLRLSDQPIASDLISRGSADMILSDEPMEALRYLPYLSENGVVVTNSKPFINIPNYPEIDDLIAELKKLPEVIIIDADDIAKEFGSIHASNMVMLGAASPFIQISFENIEEGIRRIFQKKGEEVLEMDLQAARAGRDFVLLRK